MYGHSYEKVYACKGEAGIYLDASSQFSCFCGLQAMLFV